MSMIFKFHRRTSKPAATGTPMHKGGFLVGNINPSATTAGASATHELIVSSKVLGGQAATTLLWGSYGTTRGTTSVGDGLTNSNTLYGFGEAAHPAAYFCRTLNIGGYSDWYLPARDELEFMYRVLKPNTSALQANNTSYPTNPNYVSVPNFTTKYTTTVPDQTLIEEFKGTNSEALVASNYWSSSEGSATASWRVNFVTGAGAQSIQVDCVQRACGQESCYLAVLLLFYFPAFIAFCFYALFMLLNSCIKRAFSIGLEQRWWDYNF